MLLKDKAENCGIEDITRYKPAKLRVSQCLAQKLSYLYTRRKSPVDM